MARYQNYTQDLNAPNLETINDKQKMLLAQLSYLNINKEGIEKANRGELTVADLKQYLSTPDNFMYGNIVVGSKNASIGVASAIVGKDVIQTDAELLQEMIDNGLGDLKITAWESHAFTGLQAAAVQDAYGQVGVSYRGTDFDWSQGALTDVVIGDVAEYVVDDNIQRKQAVQFFDQVKTEGTHNYVYGHSLGGNISSYVTLDRSDDIARTFCFNANPIDQKHLDTPEKIALFNSEKLEFTVICGDVVGHFKPHDLYSENVKYIKNNELTTEGCNPIRAHLPQAATLDKDGNFVYATEEMLKSIHPQVAKFAQTSHDVKSAINAHKEGELSIMDICKDYFSGDVSLKDVIQRFRDGDIRVFGSWEQAVDLNDLFRSEHAQTENLDWQNIKQIAGNTISAGWDGLKQDAQEFVEGIKDKFDGPEEDINHNR